MHDSTESDRRALLAEMRAKGPLSREDLETEHGKVWSTQELLDDFEVVGSSAPFVVVRRKADNVKGSLLFQHDPRLYFAFQPA